MYDPLLMASLLLLFVTLVAVLLYHRGIKRVQKEYEKAKVTVEDIIISFNSQVQRQDERVDLITHKTEAVSSRLEKTWKKAKGHDSQLADLTAKVENLLEVQPKVVGQIKRMGEHFKNLSAKQARIMEKIEEVRMVEHKVLSVPEVKVEAVIPIKREKALAPLTETELSVLDILATEGAKTAPNIRARISLTREHTARLMKKLYEAGYLERDTRKMPYKYHVKKEMLKILKKTETKA